VIGNEVANPDAVREAGVFLGRSIELQHGLTSEAVQAYLKALGRDNSNISVVKIFSDLDQRNRMYSDLAQILVDVNTHGTEKYMTWFRAQIDVPI